MRDRIVRLRPTESIACSRLHGKPRPLDSCPERGSRESLSLEPLFTAHGIQRRPLRHGWRQGDLPPGLARVCLVTGGRNGLAAGTLRWCRSRLRGVWNLIEEADIESQYKQKLIMQQSAPVSKGSGRPALLTASDARPARESSPARLVRPLAPRMASVSSEVPPVARPRHAARDGRRLNVCPAWTCAPGLG